MRYINLGSSDMKVSSIGLGCMGMTHAYGAPSDEAEMIKLIHAAVDMGVTFFDTAECYTGTDKNGQLVYNEELVGKALKPYRDKVVIATKFGVHHNSDLSLKTDSRPEIIRKSIEGSLTRLGTDYIDLYYQHRVDPDVPVEEVAGTLQDLIREGKVRCWGMSEVTENTIRRADKVCHLTAVQNRYSMMCRHYENLIPILKEMGIAFVAHSPMANGYLTGKYDGDSEFDKKNDYRSSMPHFAGAATPYMDTSSKAAILGLTFEHTKTDIYKALMEGTAYEIALNLEILKKHGLSARTVIATGGGARSDVWLQIKADVLGLAVTALDGKEIGGAGTAIMAGRAIGVYDENTLLAKPQKTFYPDEKQHAYYKNQLEKYRKIYAATKEVMHDE